MSEDEKRSSGVIHRRTGEHVVKRGDNYIAQLAHVYYGRPMSLDDVTWTMSQRLAFRWKERNPSADVARRIDGRVIALTYPFHSREVSP